MSTLRMNPVDPFDLWSDQKFIKSKYEQNSISKVKKQEKEVCLFDNGSKLQVVKCQLCSSNIFPYCPNPNEIIWMWENEDCIYPFGDAPHHVDEVCLFKPQNSSCSLSKQAQLIQEGKLGSNSGKSKDTKVEVQTELCESMRKVKSLLTNYQQNCGPDCSCNSENYQECLDNVNHPDHFRLMPERKLGDHQEFSFSIESDTMFKVEKSMLVSIFKCIIFLRFRFWKWPNLKFL